MAKVLIAGEPGNPIEVLEAELAGQGFQVVVAVTGQEAYESVLHEKPDAVILAARMPVFDGLTTCRMLRDDPDIPPELPVFLMSENAVHAKSIERAEVTEVINPRHEASELRELLTRHLGKAVWPDL
ncbi:MAG: response regulator [Candidatus Hydrogenedentes bacterium]|nr:response regulator [Candidatus Hydrogenedentota bacterium]